MNTPGSRVRPANNPRIPAPTQSAQRARTNAQTASARNTGSVYGGTSAKEVGKMSVHPPPRSR